MPDLQDTENGEDGNRGQNDSPAEVGGDQDRAAMDAVGKNASGRTEKECGDAADRGEKTHLGRCRLQNQDGGERQTLPRDARANLGNSLTDPEFEELAGAPQGALHPSILAVCDSRGGSKNKTGR